MQDNHKKQFYKTLILSLIFLSVFSMRHLLVGALLFLPFLITWFIKNTVTIFTRPKPHTWLIRRMAIWVLACSCIGIIHYYYHVSTRNNANAIVSVIEKYKTAHGTYPATNELTGLTKEQVKQKMVMGNYSLADGKPFLYYAVTYIAFDIYRYDFEHKKWDYDAD